MDPNFLLLLLDLVLFEFLFPQLFVPLIIAAVDYVENVTNNKLLWGLQVAQKIISYQSFCYLLVLEIYMYVDLFF